MELNRITSDAARLGGQPCIRDLRITCSLLRSMTVVDLTLKRLERLEKSSHETNELLGRVVTILEAHSRQFERVEDSSMAHQRASTGSPPQSPVAARMTLSLWSSAARARRRRRRYRIAAIEPAGSLPARST
jgi:hypothetical protein